MDSFVQELKFLTKETANRMPVTQAYGEIVHFYLPGQGKNPERTHWSGSEGDPTTGGFPIVMLLQGPRDRQTGRLRPDKLPNGKTAVDLLNQYLEQEGVSFGVELLFEKTNKKLMLYLVDLEQFDQWQDFLAKTARASKKPATEQVQATEEPEMSLDEWRFKKFGIPMPTSKKTQAHAQAQAQAQDEEWVEVPKRTKPT